MTNDIVGGRCGGQLSIVESLWADYFTCGRWLKLCNASATPVVHAILMHYAFILP